MHIQRLATSFVKLSILCLIAWLIWHLSRTPAHGLTRFDIEEAAEQTQPEVPVHLGMISRKNMHDYLSVFGTVEPAPATTDAPAAGAAVSVANWSVVTEVACIEGQLVARGQPLFTVTERGAKAPVVVTSPLAGTIVQLNIRPGETANPRTTAVEIVDLHRLVINAGVPGFDLNQIHPGDGAVVDGESSNSTTQPSDSASVIRIDSNVDPSTGMGSVDFAAPAAMVLRPGQPLRVKIAVADHQNALAVPQESIVRDSQGRPAVAVLIRNGRWAELQPVDIGLTEDGSVEIRGGHFTAGQQIVTGGAYALPDAAAIRVLKD